jgi:hypothetical protein
MLASAITPEATPLQRLPADSFTLTRNSCWQPSVGSSLPAQISCVSKTAKQVSLTAQSKKCKPLYLKAPHLLANLAFRQLYTASLFAPKIHVCRPRH